MTLATTTRRRFIELLPLSGLAVLAACSKEPEAVTPAAETPQPAPMPTPTPAPAPAPSTSGPGADAPMVDETEATAAALGYVAVASRVDKARFPTYVEGSKCSNCLIYQGAAGSEAGGCPLFVGRLVAAEGWCSSWVKKA